MAEGRTNRGGLSLSEDSFEDNGTMQTEEKPRYVVSTRRDDNYVFGDVDLNQRRYIDRYI